MFKLQLLKLPIHRIYVLNQNYIFIAFSAVGLILQAQITQSVNFVHTSVDSGLFKVPTISNNWDSNVYVLPNPFTPHTILAFDYFKMIKHFAKVFKHHWLIMPLNYDKMKTNSTQCFKHCANLPISLGIYLS